MSRFQLFIPKYRIILVLFFSFFLNVCGLPPGPNTAPTFATLFPSSPILPDPSPSQPINSRNPQIAVDSTGIYVAWENSSDGNILFSSSKDGGSTFSIPIVIPNSTNGTYPRITTDGNGNSFVLWQSPTQFLLNYSTSSQFRTSAVTIANLCSSQSSQNSIPQADIIYNQNNLLITWAQVSCSSPTPYQIYFDSLLAQNPVTPSVPTKQILSESGFNGYPKISQLAGDPDIAYLQTSVSDLVLTEYSVTFDTQTSFRVNSQSIPASVSLATDGNGNRYVAWAAHNPSQSGFDIYINNLNTGTTTFPVPPHNLTLNGASYGPAIGIDSSQYVYVTFFSRSTAFPTTYDVFLERSSDGGKNFIGPVNISNSSGDSFSYEPGMAVLGKTAYFVWDDNTNSTFHHIHFQKVTLN
ncbi:MAG: hypothetical protein HY200_08860 [Nitrospirae bacterium]|nr:hypothetical protein [Nitrospirota bacterium]